MRLYKQYSTHIQTKHRYTFCNLIFESIRLLWGEGGRVVFTSVILYFEGRNGWMFLLWLSGFFCHWWGFFFGGGWVLGFFGVVLLLILFIYFLK